MDSAQKRRLLEIIDSLPALPATVNNVLEVTSNPESSAQDLMNAVLPDQSMCLAILKIANSALFGQQKQVKSIERAVMVLGFNEVQSIILSKAVVGAFSEYSQDYEKEIDSLWEHSFATGLAAKIIAEHYNLPSGDLFVAGLIHDVGKLIMFLTYIEKYDPSQWMADASSQEKMNQERDVFSQDHTMIGLKLLNHWSFPSMLLNAVRYHHDPEEIGKGMGYPLVIQLADYLAHLCDNLHLLEEESLNDIVLSGLPGIQDRWEKCGLAWDEEVLESWFAWLKIDKANGGAVMSILSS